MKKLLLIVVAAVVGVVTAEAQSVAVVDSEKVFMSLNEYTAALTTVDAKTKEYQGEVERRFADVEQMFNLYALGRASYSEAKRVETEALILAKEKEATEYQEQCFAEDGAIMKLRVELITPIQERVFKVIDNYAKEEKIELMLDKSTLPSVLYNSSAIDHTQQIINLLGGNATATK